MKNISDNTNNFLIENNNNNNNNNNEIIIELEILNFQKLKEINIICNKNKLIEDIKTYEDFYKTNNLQPPKLFEYFNKENTKLYINEKEETFQEKIKFEKK